MPAIAPLRPSGLHLPRFEMAPAPQYQPLRTAPVPEFSRELLAIPTGAERMTAGLGQALEVLKDAAVQSGLRNVLEGRAYDAPKSDEFGDRAAATLRHAFDGTMGQHAAGVRPSVYDRPTPITDPISGRQIASLPAAGNVVAGPDGRLAYDPNRGLGLAQAGMSFRQAGNAAEMSDLQLRAARDAEAQRKKNEGVNIFDRAGQVAPAPPGSVLPERVPQASATSPDGGDVISGKATRFGDVRTPDGRLVPDNSDRDAVARGVKVGPGFQARKMADGTPFEQGPDHAAIALPQSVMKARGLKLGDTVMGRIGDGPEVPLTIKEVGPGQGPQARGVVADLTQGAISAMGGTGDNHSNFTYRIPQRGGGGPLSSPSVSDFDRPAADVAPQIPAQADMQRDAGPLSGGPVPEPSFNAAPPQVGPLSGGVAGGAGAQYPLSGEGIAQAIADQGGTDAMQAQSGRGPFPVPRMSTAMPKGAGAAATPPAGAQKAADQAVGLQEAPDQITLVGRYGYDSQGNRKFVSNAELAALGMPPGNETRPIPRFFQAKVGEDEVGNFERLQNGEIKQLKKGPIRPMTAETLLRKYDLPEEFLDDLIASAPGSQNIDKRMENRALQIRNQLKAGKGVDDIRAQTLFGKDYDSKDPAQSSIAYLSATQKGGKGYDGSRAASLIKRARAENDPEAASEIVRGAAVDLMEGESKKRYSQAATIGTMAESLKAKYEFLRSKGLGGDDNFFGNSIPALEQQLNFFLGKLKKDNPEFAELKVATEGALADLLSIRSGAAVTEGEAKRFGNLLPVLKDTSGLALLKLDVMVKSQKSLQWAYLSEQLGKTNTAALFGPPPGSMKTGGSPPAAQPAGKPADAPVPSVASAAEYNAIPAGSLYRGPDGQVRRKP